MTDSLTNAKRVEQERQERLAELAADQGTEWNSSYRSGSFGCHELLDRSAVVADMVERFLLGHPSCIANAEWNALAEQAAASLRELYQRIGAEHLQTIDSNESAHAMPNGEVGASRDFSS